MMDKDIQNLKIAILNDGDVSFFKNRLATRMRKGQMTLYSLLSKEFLQNPRIQASVRIASLELLTGLRNRKFDKLAAENINYALLCDDELIQAAAISCILNLRVGVRGSFLKEVKKLRKSKKVIVREAAKAYVSLEKRFKGITWWKKVLHIRP